jgi:hypothetical protein
MKKIQCSVTEYATLRGISRQAVLERLKENKILLHVLSYKKIGNTWILDVDRQFYNNPKQKSIDSLI